MVEKINEQKQPVPLTEKSDTPKDLTLFFTDEFITIGVDTANQWLYANWIGYQTEGTVMAGCEKMLEALQQFGLVKVLNDNSHVLGIWTPAAHWVGTNWFPRMEAAGLKYFAWIYSPSRLSQVSTNESISSTPLPHLIQTFYNIEEGKTWLQSVV